jgi:hypothetical protein
MGGYYDIYSPHQYFPSRKGLIGGYMMKAIEKKTDS